MRLFVAADLPAGARAQLAAVALGDGWRPVPQASLHITLAFLGEAEPEPVIEALRPLELPRVPATTGRLLTLPPRRPRVVAVELAAPALLGVQARVAEALVAAGVFEPEARPFLPHVTLGRVRRGERPARSGAGPPRLAFDVASITLYRSEPDSRYSALFRSTLRG